MEFNERKQALKVATKAALVGGAVALKYFRRLKKVSLKQNASLVSEADQESEAKIKDIILSRYPDHQFLGEEGGMVEGKSLALWHVDPLDGTTNYVHGFPFFCVSIGLEVGKHLEVAVVYAPLLKQLYTATRGGGAHLNGKPIYVSGTKRLQDSLLATGFSYVGRKYLEKEIRDFKKLSGYARGVRRAGSAALDFCMVASGVFDGFWERGLATWDTAAGTLIVREAGGTVTDFRGKRFSLREDNVVATNRRIHPLITTVLSTR